MYYTRVYREEVAVQEKDIEKILVAEVRGLGGRAYKWVSPGSNGVPDRIVFFPGRPPVFVEMKSDKGKLTATQEVQIKRLQELGQIVFVVKGIAGLSQFFQSCGYNEVSKSIEKRYMS